MVSTHGSTEVTAPILTASSRLPAQAWMQGGSVVQPRRAVRAILHLGACLGRYSGLLRPSTGEACCPASNTVCELGSVGPIVIYIRASVDAGTTLP